MRIALDGRLWDFPKAEQRFFGAGIIEHLLQWEENHDFFVILDQAAPSYLPQNVRDKPLILKPKAQSAASRALWYDMRLPALLSAHQIDLFIGLAGYISLRTPVPQVLVLQDVQSPEWSGEPTGWNGSLYRRRLKSMMQKSLCHLSVSHWQKNCLPVHEAAKARVMPVGPLFFPETVQDPSLRESVKERLTGGMEYYVCIEGWQNAEEAMDLLIAFAAFKKRQLTGMKLVLMGDGPKEKSWHEKLKTYRYRDDLILINEEDLTEQLSVLAAAYGLIHLPGEPRLLWIQYAFKLGVPVITWPQDGIRELAKDAACYCSELPGQSLAQWMMRLYKDEQERKMSVQKGLGLAENWLPEKLAAGLIHLSEIAYQNA